MVVDPAPSLRGTAGHSLPPLRLVQRRPGECRIVVEIIRLRRNLLDAPRADVLIEDRGKLQRSERRAAVRSEQRSRGEGMGDDDDMATQEQQHAGWRSTYREHVAHARHRAHVPIADGLIEGRGFLQRREKRAAMWSERRSRSEGMGDDDDMATQEQQHAGWRNTYSEHAVHVRHRAHVPITDGLVEGLGSLQRSEGRASVWSE